MAIVDHIVASGLARLRRRSERHHVSTVLRRCQAVGTGSVIRGRIRCTGAEMIRLGDNVVINDNANIRAEGGLTIGSNTHIARNLVLYTINHRFEGDLLPYDGDLDHGPVTIGRNVWIGINVCIVPGTVIGDGAVIGMGTVVSGTVPPLAIVAGGPWRIVGERDAERYERLDAASAYGGTDGEPL